MKTSEELTDALDAIFAEIEATIDAMPPPQAPTPSSPNLKQADELTRRFVSPEIAATDTDHPDFNADGWNRIRRQWIETGDLATGEWWLWIHSKASGVCKTRCAFLALREWLRERAKTKHEQRKTQPRLLHHRESHDDPKVVWVDGDDLTEAFRNKLQFSLGDDTMREAHRLVSRATKADILVIDDLTKRKMASEAVSDGFWQVLKHRHQWHLTTVITDNTPIQGIRNTLHQKHADPIIRRLAERCIEFDFD